MDEDISQKQIQAVANQFRIGEPVKYQNWEIYASSDEHGPYGPSIAFTDFDGIVDCYWKDGLLEGKAIVTVKHVLVGLYLVSRGIVTKQFLTDASSIDIIDISDSGERWEGEVIEGVPYGWGEYFDHHNHLVYVGFRVNTRTTCRGSFFFDDLEFPKYIGTQCDGKYIGRGSLYDRNGDLVFEGEWINGIPVSTHQLYIHPHKTVVGMHSDLRVITIDSVRSDLPSDFHFCGHYAFLRYLAFGVGSCPSVYSLQIAYLPQLRSVSFGDNSFNLKDRCMSADCQRAFSVRCCPSLISLRFGNESFQDAHHFVVEGI